MRERHLNGQEYDVGVAHGRGDEGGRFAGVGLSASDFENARVGAGPFERGLQRGGNAGVGIGVEHHQGAFALAHAGDVVHQALGAERQVGLFHPGMVACLR